MCQPGRPVSPRRLPERVLAGLVRLPEGEVARILLARVRLLLLHLIRLLSREPTVLGPSRDPEVDVAVDLVGEAALDQVGDERNDLVHRLGHLRPEVDLVEPEAAGVLEVPLRRLARALGAGARGGLVDLVVDVGDVVDERDVVAALAQPALVPAREHERPCVADVGACVDGRAADVHADRSRRRRQLDEVAREGAIEPHRPASAPRPAGARRSRSRARARARRRSERAAAPSGRRRRPSARGRCPSRRARWRAARRTG